jgi:uncharacterized protein (TIGR02118 family)
MVKVYAMYKHPADAAAFDKYYFATHVPTAKKMPGLLGYEVTRGPLSMLGGAKPPYHLVATLSFASKAAIDAALASPAGQATAADLGNFATAGVDIMIAETESV